MRPYHRGLYRLPLSYPAMYCVTSAVGEGKISNLSAVGCSIETDEPLSESQQVALRLLLPDKTESLPIDAAEVRWVQGTRAGIAFIQIAREANLRLHAFVWDKMVERIQIIQQQRTTSAQKSNALESTMLLPSPVLPHRGQADKPDSDPDQFTETP